MVPSDSFGVRGLGAHELLHRRARPSRTAMPAFKALKESYDAE